MSARRAFTVVEVVAALALLALLVTLIIGSMSTMRDRALWVRENTSRQRDISIAIDRLSSALRATMVNAPTSGAGVVGSPTRISVLTRIASLGRGSAGDLAKFSLVGENRSRELEGIWAHAIGDARSETHVLGRRVITNLRYHDGDAWQTSFDSAEAGRLPVAVEVSFWFINSDGSLEDASDIAVELPKREPDRRRVIAIPDARGDA